MLLIRNWYEQFIHDALKGPHKIIEVILTTIVTRFFNFHKKEFTERMIVICSVFSELYTHIV